jgi:hypothetical protein
MPPNLHGVYILFFSQHYHWCFRYLFSFYIRVCLLNGTDLLDIAMFAMKTQSNESKT